MFHRVPREDLFEGRSLSLASVIRRELATERTVIRAEATARTKPLGSAFSDQCTGKAQINE